MNYGALQMINRKLVDAFNDQIAFEIHSALIYKAMQAYFAAEDFPGMANWMNVQFQEEMAHAEKMFTFVCNAGGRARMLALEEPRNDYDSPLEVFETALTHEQLVTSRIDNLMELAQQEKNHAAQICLQWFITEQIEEEANAGLIIKKLKLVEGDGRGLLMIDQELAQRVFVPIAPA
jgi:ferritin